jgi:hypothetical protein
MSWRKVVHMYIVESSWLCIMSKYWTPSRLCIMSQDVVPVYSESSWLCIMSQDWTPSRLYIVSQEWTPSRTLMLVESSWLCIMSQDVVPEYSGIVMTMYNVPELDTVSNTPADASIYTCTTEWRIYGVPRMIPKLNCGISYYYVYSAKQKRINCMPLSFS